MGNLRVLVVDDRQDWLEEVKQLLQRLGGLVIVDLASSYDEALDQTKRELYDLMVVDLALSDNSRDPQNQQGLDLLKVVRESPTNKHCGLIMLTGHGTITRAKRALHDYDVHDFIEKEKFAYTDLVETSRAAILDARLKRAEIRAKERMQLTITFSQEQMIGSELIGPDQHSTYVAERRRRFSVADLTNRADNLNLQVLKGGDIWRPLARSIGNEIYHALSTEPGVRNSLIAAQALTQHPRDLWLQFSGPPIGLGIPFELLYNGDYYLSYNHILTRRLLQTSPRPSRKTKPFHAFLMGLLKQHETLRVLIVGADVDSKIPAAEAEAVSLKNTIESDLKQLGIAHHVKMLLGTDASYAKVREVLHNGRYHIFHYAGHAHYEDRLPEVSGLILNDDYDLHVLTAAELNTLVHDTELHLVFLSCCLGARNATKVGHGDFYGMLEALARADVPTVLGYRWTVTDESALRLAQVFYKGLWSTFSPGEALLDARVNATLGPGGRDDETWASPVLLMQNV